MATNRETYKTDELLAVAFDWHCNTTDCASCEHFKTKRGSRSHCFLAWMRSETGAALNLKPCKICGSEANLSFRDAVVSCSKCGYEVRRPCRCNPVKLKDDMKKVADLWNKLQEGS